MADDNNLPLTTRRAAAIAAAPIRVRKRHPADGSDQAGRAVGPTLNVTRTYWTEPCDAVSSGGLACDLSDGSWEFHQNLQPVEWPAAFFANTKKEG